MAKVVVFNQDDPCIGIILEEVPEGTPGRAQGVHGRCTECWNPMHWWHMERALPAAQAHVDAHQPVLWPAGDTDALIR